MEDREILEGAAVRPLKRVEYEQLTACGVFADERVELLRGFLVRMAPQGGPHADAIARLHTLLVRALPQQTQIRAHSPFAASDDSEPEPDIAVVPLGDYRDGHPAQAFLLVEAADSSLRKDRAVKGPLYAASGVPEYWLIDLEANVVEVYRDPDSNGYRTVDRVGVGATLHPLAFPDAAIPVRGFLPG